MQYDLFHGMKEAVSSNLTRSTNGERDRGPGESPPMAWKRVVPGDRIDRGQGARGADDTRDPAGATALMEFFPGARELGSVLLRRDGFSTRR